jgi:hypothetical protein
MSAMPTRLGNAVRDVRHELPDRQVRAVVDAERGEQGHVGEPRPGDVEGNLDYPIDFYRWIC